MSSPPASLSLSEKRPLLSRPTPKNTPGKSKRTKSKPVLVIHGGAGTITREGSTPERQEAYKKALRAALVKGYEVLKKGGEAMDAAVEAVGVMEDCPLFNSGKGAVFNVAGKNELEASIMLSRPPSSPSSPSIPPNRRGLSLTLLTRTRNPARTARLLYLSPSPAPHPFLSGQAAEEIAQSLGEELVEPGYFYTEESLHPFDFEGRRSDYLDEDEGDAMMNMMPKGTVGAVALDTSGCIAAVTSTGGRTNKLVGRIGDTPHMGAGFWAEEWSSSPRGLKGIWRKLTGRGGRKRSVGVSGTGDGDYFIRYNAAATIAHRMQFLNESLQKASHTVVSNDLGANEGAGGVIALDEQGNYALPMNVSGMYRGVIKADGVPKVAIFADEELE